MSTQPGTTAGSKGLLEELEQRSVAWQLTALALCGVGAALAVAFIELHLRIPGNAILRAALPISCGLAIAPRRMAGMTMSGVACLTALGLKFSELDNPGLPAFTSMTLLGPLLDLARFQVTNKRWLTVRLILAGVAANLSACYVRAFVTWFEVNPTKTRPFSKPISFAWSYPLMTYLVCGALAGLIAAIAWRCSHRKSEQPS